MFNGIDGDFEDAAIRTFKVGIPTEIELRKSLTRKLARNMRQLMDRIDEYKRVKEDQQQGKGKAKVIPLIEEISIQIGITTIGQEGTFQSLKGSPRHKQLTQFSGNLCTRSLTK